MGDMHCRQQNQQVYAPGRSPLHRSVVNYFSTPLVLPSLIFTTVPPHHDREDGKGEHLLFPEGTIANLRTCGIYLIHRLRQTVQE